MIRVHAGGVEQWGGGRSNNREMEKTRGAVITDSGVNGGVTSTEEEPGTGVTHCDKQTDTRISLQDHNSNEGRNQDDNRMGALPGATQALPTGHGIQRGSSLSMNTQLTGKNGMEAEAEASPENTYADVDTSNREYRK